ncbi:MULTISPECIES: 23S ribosomal RNA methyltransferase Erm [unclassified Brachybacterium]|uniref:23S ribosomal RNA methyltransferase Erm n=1 Tax=unclassified Brachybacterium TaxID=2623841 RepID=UPI00360D45EB
MHRHHPGAHELGQNFLRDRRVIGRIVELVAATDGAIVEWGAGDGALTLPLSRLGRPLEAVEIDERAVHALSRRVPAHVTVRCGDILRHAPPAGSTLVANLPYHLTTPALRHLFRAGGWSDALLITQWEVARKRAGVGGVTMMTAQWWPWFEVSLDRRIPATAFRPRPSVDSGLLIIRRRREPLVPAADRRAYHRLVRDVFTGPGRGIEQILRRSGGLTARQARTFCDRFGYHPRALPRDVDPADWAEAFALSGPERRRG